MLTSSVSKLLLLLFRDIFYCWFIYCSGYIWNKTETKQFCL